MSRKIGYRVEREAKFTLVMGALLNSALLFRIDMVIGGAARS